MTDIDLYDFFKSTGDLRAYAAALESGESFTLLLDASEAAAPIVAMFESSDGAAQRTPYQTVDAGHAPERAAELAREHFAQTPEEKADRIASVEKVSVPEFAHPDEEDAGPAMR